MPPIFHTNMFFALLFASYNAQLTLNKLKNIPYYDKISTRNNEFIITKQVFSNKRGKS